LAKNLPDPIVMKNKSYPSDEDRLHWIHLARTPFIGPITFQKLCKKFGSPKEILYQASRLPELIRLFANHPLPSVSNIQREIEETQKNGGEIILLDQPEYPALLRFIADPPPVITILGNQALLQLPKVAIVGARQASAAGCKIAELLALGLGKAGLTVVSGMAKGIDQAAHRGSLTTGTIAVLAGGADHIYPPQHQELYRQIKEQGLIVSEQPWGTIPQAGFFPRRNRLISGLSLGIIVVEATAKSGSLITAKMALEQGREVFAVPGSPLDGRSYGPNNLIRQGAVLTESAEDVIHSLPDFDTNARPSDTLIKNIRSFQIAKSPSPHTPSFIPPFAEIESTILQKLAITPISIDELANECQLSLADLRVILTELEMDGKVRRHLGDKVSLGITN